MREHQPAAYDGMCIACGMTPNQQIGYGCTSPASPFDIDYGEWYERHVDCANRNCEDSAFIAVLGEHGPHLCDRHKDLQAEQEYQSRMLDPMLMGEYFNERINP